MSDYARFDLGAPLGRLVTSNQYHGKHWSKSHADKVLWRDGMSVLARAKHIDQWVSDRPTLVRFVFPVPDKRRRDPSNLVGTVVKWCVDGLVRGGVWPDDDPRFVTILEPLLIPGADRVQLELWARPNARENR